MPFRTKKEKTTRITVKWQPVHVRDSQFGILFEKFMRKHGYHRKGAESTLDGITEIYHLVPEGTEDEWQKPTRATR